MSMPHSKARAALLLIFLFPAAPARGADPSPLLERTGKIRLHVASERAFLLFTPEGEEWSFTTAPTRRSGS
jgi:hypothetical protein